MIKEIIECLDGVDPENLRNQLHEDFLFVDELVMETPVEYVEAMEGMWSRNIDLTVERKIVADERDCCGFSFVREIEGVKHVITNLYLLKKGKIWRHIINQCQLIASMKQFHFCNRQILMALKILHKFNHSA